MVLVTGGTGFIGKAAVRRLRADGYRVRVLARDSADVEPVVRMGAEVSRGDVADRGSFERAFEACDYVVHLAAGTSGSPQDSETATLMGTRTLLDLCRQHKPRRLVYISSCSVYGVAECAAGARITETSSLEPFPERRGVYSASKQRAEEYVTAFMRTENPPVAILRPGTVYGRGGNAFPRTVGYAAGGSWYVVIGDGSLMLSLVHVDNLAAAISLCLSRKEAAGEIYNVVDPESLTRREYVDRVIRRLDARARVLYVPYTLVHAMTGLQELSFALVRRRPFLSRYRLKSSQKRVWYDGTKIASRLGWSPPVSLNDALEELGTHPQSSATTHGAAVRPGVSFW